MRAETENTSKKTNTPSTPRELILDVLGTLGWGGCVRVGGVSVHIHSVPTGGTWREGVVRVETITSDGRRGEACPWPAMTDAQAVAEAVELIEYFASRWGSGAGHAARISAAREQLRVTAEQQGGD